jgi:hypothetical protein
VTGSKFGVGAAFELAMVVDVWTSVKAGEEVVSMEVVAATAEFGFVDIEVKFTEGSLKDVPTPIFKIEL